ncbi:MAG: AlpA family phage regulatory protein [Thiolinea sp.]
MKRKSAPTLETVNPPPLTVLSSFPMLEANDRLLCMSDVVALTARQPSTVYANIKRGVFPAPIKCGTRASRWKLSEINAYINGTYTKPPAETALPTLKLVRKGGKV